MGRIAVLFISFLLVSCIYKKDAPNLEILYGQKDSLDNREKIRIYANKKAKIYLHKGVLSYYMSAALYNQSNTDKTLKMGCAYYTKDKQAGEKHIFLISVPPKSKKKFFKRLFLIEQRFDWRCKIL